VRYLEARIEQVLYPDRKLEREKINVGCSIIISVENTVANYCPSDTKFAELSMSAALGS
jgi:hypothetical protein